MGYGTEAAKLMIDYMFKEVGIEKIETSAAIVNQSSWKIMEKLGFSKINKTKMVNYTLLGEDVECYCYEMTRDKYLCEIKRKVKKKI